MYTDESYRRQNWQRKFDLLSNAVGILNETLGCRYHHAPTNPCTVLWRNGMYYLSFCGTEYARFALYDDAGLADAVYWCRTCCNCVWHLRRNGMCKV